jgi:hypothetical protein
LLQPFVSGGILLFSAANVWGDSLPIFVNGKECVVRLLRVDPIGDNASVKGDERKRYLLPLSGAVKPREAGTARAEVRV